MTINCIKPYSHFQLTRCSSPNRFDALGHFSQSEGLVAVSNEAAELKVIHEPYVVQLADAGDWAALCRYWIALQHSPALDLAVTVAEWREGSREARCLAF